MSGVRLSDPEVIHDFRRHLAGLLRLCAVALEGGPGELQRGREWLRGDRLLHWKAQLRHREEEHATARRLWLEAVADVRRSQSNRGGGKQSGIDEQKNLERARRRMDETAQRLAAVKSWMLRLEQEAEPLLRQLRDHDLALRELGLHALTQLDHLADRVEAYLDVPTAMPPGPATTSSQSGMTQTEIASSTVPRDAACLP